MLQKILPQSVYSVIDSRLNEKKLYELRLRSGMPTVINYGGRYYYLTPKGISETCDNAIESSVDDIGLLVVRACEHSLYAANDRLLDGYITISGGIRIGVCGELVQDDGKNKTIKNFSSVNIRFPHEIQGCGHTAYAYINAAHIRSALIVSPPGCGKTTVLRDLCRSISNDGIRNVLLVDERGEIASVCNGRPCLDVGKTTDIIYNATKKYAFRYAVRSMRPDVIVADELMSEEDAQAVLNAVSSGVAVIASVHAADVDELRAKTALEGLVKSKAISRYVVLSDRNGPGTYDGIFDAELRCICRIC